MTEEIKFGGKNLFPPGVSGNPAGRPKGSKNKVSYVVLDALEKKVKEGEEKSNLDALVDMLLRKALTKEDLKAVEILLDRGFGKAKEFVEISAPEEVIISDMGEEVEDESNSGGRENPS